MRLIHFLQKIDEQALYEAAKDRYLQMFQNPVYQLGDGPAYVKNTVAWAMQNLGKADRISWFLRAAQYSILNAIHHDVRTEMEWHANNPETVTELRPQVEMLDKARNKMLGKLAKFWNTDTNGAHAFAMKIINSKSQWQHLFSLDYQPIQNYQIDKQTPDQVLEDLHNLEKKYQMLANQTIRGVQSGSEIILKFPDGSAWWNLHQSSCDREAKAMGHCGNVPTAKPGQEVLSYRTPAPDNDQGVDWVPHLTFIYQTNDGSLGEMKGRNNQKPDRKYHPVIMELLKQPFVKEVRGGGYKPMNNFMLKDLSSEDRQKLNTVRPDLKSPFDKYYETKELDDDMFNVLQQTAQNQGESLEGYDENSIIVATDMSVVDIYEQYSDKYIGEWQSEHADVEQLLEALAKNDQETLRKLKIYLQQEHSVDLRDVHGKELADFIKQEDIELYDAITEFLTRYHSQGVLGGAESNLYFASEWGNEDSEYALVDFVRESGGNYSVHVPIEEFMNKVYPAMQERRISDSLQVDLPDPYDEYSEELNSNPEEMYESMIEEFKEDDGIKAVLNQSLTEPERGERDFGQMRLFDEFGL